jgi:hypothetical protein
MAFAAALIGLLSLFFAIGRLLWPDPDGSLDSRNHDEFHKMLKATEGSSLMALLHKLFVPLIAVFYFPFLKPGAGIAVGIALIGLAVAVEAR